MLLVMLFVVCVFLDGANICFILMWVPTIATIVAHPCFQRGGTGMIARELFSTETYTRKYRGKGARIFCHVVLFCFGFAYFCGVGFAFV